MEYCVGFFCFIFISYIIVYFFFQRTECGFNQRTPEDRTIRFDPGTLKVVQFPAPRGSAGATLTLASVARPLLNLFGEDIVVPVVVVKPVVTTAVCTTSNSKKK